MQRKKRTATDGSIYKRKDGRWVASISNGQTRHHAYGKSKKEAESKLEELRIEVNPAHDLTPNTTFAVFAERWLQYGIKTRVSESSHRLIAYQVEKYIMARLGKIPLKNLTPGRVQTFYSNLAQAELSPRMQRNIHGTLRWAFTYALHWGLVTKNPSKGAILPREPDKKVEVLTPEEIGRFLRAASKSRLYALYVLSLLGLRKGELFGLKWSDVDWKKKALTVRRRIDLHTQKVEEVKSKKSVRTITLPKLAVKVLADHQARMKAERQNSEFVFVTPNGTSLRDNWFTTQSFTPVLKDAGIRRIRFHDLRHTAASLLLLLNVNPKIVTERLGHASVKFTMDTYSHLIPGMQGIAADKLERMFGEVADEPRKPKR